MTNAGKEQVDGNGASFWVGGYQLNNPNPVAAGTIYLGRGIDFIWVTVRSLVRMNEIRIVEFGQKGASLATDQYFTNIEGCRCASNWTKPPGDVSK